MRIEQYEELFAKGEPVHLDAPGGSRLVMLPPNPADPEAGFTVETTATTVVELSRAVAGWLAVHKRLFGWWHALYRKINPGGLLPGSRGKVIDEQERIIERMSAERLELLAYAKIIVRADPAGAVHGRRVLALLEGEDDVAARRVVSGGRCAPCGAEIYMSERVAFRTALTLSRGKGGGYSAYRCPSGGRGWHVVAGDAPTPVPPPAVPVEGVARIGTPMDTARDHVAADMAGRLDADGVAWLIDRPLLWLRALVEARMNLDDDIAAARRVPKDGHAEQQRAAAGNLARLEIHKRLTGRLSDVRTLIGEEPLDRTSLAECVTRFTTVCALVDAGKHLDAGALARSTVRLLTGAPDDETHSVDGS